MKLALTSGSPGARMRIAGTLTSGASPTCAVDAAIIGLVVDSRRATDRPTLPPFSGVSFAFTQEHRRMAWRVRVRPYN